MLAEQIQQNTAAGTHSQLLQQHYYYYYFFYLFVSSAASTSTSSSSSTATSCILMIDRADCAGWARLQVAGSLQEGRSRWLTGCFGETRCPAPQLELRSSHSHHPLGFGHSSPIRGFARNAASSDAASDELFCAFMLCNHTFADVSTHLLS